MNLAIAGDLHGAWGDDDRELLLKVNPDAILFVGDLGEGDFRLVKSIANLPLPSAVMLGNHDRGADASGDQLQSQLAILGDSNCSWRLRDWDYPPISVVGGRPCSPGGGYFLTTQVKGVFGPVSLEESAIRIFQASQNASKSIPLILLAHSGPSGLGSEAFSICGRDWKNPSLDWGDKDLAMAIDLIRKERSIDLVVFGHMHHKLRLGKGYRQTYYRDSLGTIYLNAASVPRKGIDESGELLSHFSWVQFLDGQIAHASHRWYRKDASIAYQETLLNTAL
nr:TIGR04168 family protein [Prochlorococcus sp. MIT 0601]